MEETVKTQNNQLIDAQLIADYRKGDEEALRQLVERYVGPLYGFIYRYLGNVADAEDIVQETFVRAWRNLSKFNIERNFKTWLFTIAKNATLDLLKKKKTVPFSGLGDTDEDFNVVNTIEDPAPLPDEIFSRLELSAELEVIMEKLSPPFRIVLHLYYVDQLNFREIAEVLEEPLDTVKSRHRRGLTKLRKLLLDLDMHQNLSLNRINK